MTGIPVRTLHYYDDIGLLHPQRQGSGHRVYETDDVMKLQKILSLKSLGFSLQNIKELLDHAEYDLSLGETLQLQQQALEATRLELDKSLEMISRMIAIIQTEGQVDHQLLFSLMRNMKEEDKQKEWVTAHLSQHTAASIFDIPKEQVAELDMEMVRFSKDVKRLCKKPVDSTEVENMIGSYIQRVASLLDTEAIENFSHLDEEQEAAVDSFVEMPFSDEEQTWFDAALAHYVGKYGMLADGKLIWKEQEVKDEMSEECSR